MAEIVCQMSEKYEEYLIDESKYKGYADSISFPESEEEIVTLLEKMKDDKDVVVVAASTPLCIGFNPERRHEAGKQFRCWNS